MATVTVQDIREHLQDFPERNLLLGEEEFSDREITLAIDLTVEDFNTMLPIITMITASAFPDALRNIILLGVLSKIYRGKSLEQERNRLAYADGGVQVNTSDRGQFYLQAANQFDTQFRQLATQWKQAINIANGFGGIGSEYAQISY